MSKAKNLSCLICMDQSQCFDIHNHINLLLKEQNLNKTYDSLYMNVCLVGG